MECVWERFDQYQGAGMCDYHEIWYKLPTEGRDCMAYTEGNSVNLPN